MASISSFEALTPRTFKAASISGLSTVPPPSASRQVNTCKKCQPARDSTQYGADIHLFHVSAGFYVDELFDCFPSFLQPTVDRDALREFF